MTTTALPRGLMGELVLADQGDFDTAASTGFETTPFYTENLSQKEGLPDDDLIGGTRANDRDQREPAPDLASHSGTIQVPLCLNNLGWWLVGAFGDPVTSGVAATGSLTFSGQPGAASTITVNGQAFTFVAGSPSTNEIQIGGSLAVTITNIKNALNASAVPGVAAATYGESGGTVVTVTHDTGGTGGNAFTLAVGAGSNATRSGATLAGGHYAHVFESGGEELPSRTLGIKRRTPAAGDAIWYRQIGCVVSMLHFRIAREAGFRRVGVDILGKSEDKAAPAAFGSPEAALALDQVAAAIGTLKIDGSAVGTLMSADADYDNGLAALDFANNTKYAAGMGLDNLAKLSGSMAVRYANETLYDWSVDRSVKALDMEWSLGTGRSLKLAMPEVRLERFGIPISGPGAIEATVPFRAEQGTATAMLTATLRNSLSAYPVP